MLSFYSLHRAKTKKLLALVSKLLFHCPNLTYFLHTYCIVNIIYQFTCIYSTASIQGNKTKVKPDDKTGSYQKYVINRSRSTRTRLVSFEKGGKNYHFFTHNKVYYKVLNSDIVMRQYLISFLKNTSHNGL